MKKVINKRNLSFLALGLPFIAPYAYSQDNASEDASEVFQLSPFEVDSSQDVGYRATSTLAGTRLRTDLKDIGSAISVVTEEFLDDTGATDNESLLLYTLGTEVGGSQGNFAGGGDGSRVDGDDQRRNPSNANRIRGLAAADSARNFYATDIPWDSFNVNRIDINRGANSILFGLGSPAGVINAGLKTAIFTDQGTAGIDFGNDGTTRGTFDYNKVLIQDQLAIRFSALESDKGFQQKEAYEENSRFFLSAQWTPDFLKTDSSHGKLTANFEDGEIEANRPRNIPPIDRITPWFDSANGELYKNTFTATEIGEYASSERPGSNYIGNEALGRIFNGPIAIYDGSGTPSRYVMAVADGQNYLGIDDATDAAASAGLPFSKIGGYKSKTLSDASIFDFYNHMLDGPNKKEWQDWTAYNLTYSHMWMDDTLGLEVGFDSQEYQDGQVNIMDNWGQAISVDIVSVFPDGTANPNAGRAIAGGESQNNRNNATDRDTFRVTGFYDYDFADSDSDSLGFLGRHLFTGLYSSQKIDRLNTTWVRNVSNGINAGSIDGAARYLSNLVYLSDDLSGMSSAAGANIQPISYNLVPHRSDQPQTIITDGGVVTPFTVSSYDNGDIGSIYKRANKARNEVESTALIWQSWLFDGLVVPMVAVRKDSVDSSNAGAAPEGPEAGSGTVLPYASGWNLPGSASQAEASSNGATYNSVSETTSTYSVVFHAPESVTEALGGTQLSLSYANSENFRPDASRLGIDGVAVPNQTGETEEFGLTISALDDKLHFKINRYETSVKNATLSGSSIANSYMIGFGEGVGRWSALQTINGTHGFEANFAMDTDPNHPLGPIFDTEDGVEVARINPDTGGQYVNTYIDPAIEVLRYEPNADETVAAALSRQEAAIATIFDPANRPSTDIEQFWNQRFDDLTGNDTWGGPDQAAAWQGEPANFSVTSDFISKGTEYELFYQPTKNWNIMLNAAKVDAQRFNIAGSYAGYVKERWDLYKGDYGQVMLYNGQNSNWETLQAKYGQEFYANYLASALINRAGVPELRKWRANLITNYSFDEGGLKGLNVGGAIRWQDKVAVGYEGTLAAEAIEEFGLEIGDEMYNINKPYYGPAETALDLWANYTINLSDKVDWKIQLNISNVTAKEELIPVTVSVDGSAATSRIAPQRTWTLANTFSF